MKFSNSLHFMRVGTGGLGCDLRIEEVPNPVSVRNMLNDNYEDVVLCIQAKRSTLIETTYPSGYFLSQLNV